MHTTAYFVNVSPAAFNHNLLPTPASTNVDGTVACVLSAGQLQAFMQTIQASNGLTQFAAPAAMATEGNRARMSVSRAIQINGAKKSYGPTVDVIHHVYGKNIELRVIATVTAAVTNTAPLTHEVSERDPVNIKTVFQSGIDARIPAGGGLMVWNRAKGSDQDSCLMIICPTSAANAVMPAVNPAAPTAPQPKSKSL